jgi:hypothetical protein
VEAFDCPADKGYDLTTVSGFPAGFYPTAYQSIGSSYRFNGLLWADTRYPAADSDYNLCLKRETWAPAPSRFIMMFEADGYAWSGLFVHWHGASAGGQMITTANLPKDPARFIAPTLFVDDHVKACNFTSAFKNNPNHPLEESEDWIWYKRQ